MTGTISRVASRGGGGFVDLGNGAMCLVYGHGLRVGDRVEFRVLLRRAGASATIFGDGALLKAALVRKLCCSDSDHSITSLD